MKVKIYNPTDLKKILLRPLDGPILIFGASISLKSGYAACSQTSNYIKGKIVYIANIKAFLRTHTYIMGEPPFSSDNREAYAQILNCLNEMYNGAQNI